MGGRPSVHIETPQFQDKDWEYLPDSHDNAEQYGLFRTLRNLKSGQKIDQYQFIWPDEEEYQYYLKSFNWRHQQTTVVSTKFIVERSKRDMCSRSYMARIYIEHMRVRLSEISDIPFPDNLYVLMEALEGYRKIFDHSKYFQIEQNQICVDDYGNLKIWVNSDLSINYPNNEGFIDYKHKGQEEMVEVLVNIIGQNTDPDTEPSPTFREYFKQKKSGKGVNFEQAKVLVLSYSRLNNTQIPVRFEAIVNLDSEEQLELKSIQDSRFNNRLGPNEQNHQISQNNSNFPSSNYIQTSQVVNHPLYMQPAFNQQIPQQYQSPPNVFHQQPYYQTQQMPIPFQPRIEHQLIPNGGSGIKQPSGYLHNIHTGHSQFPTQVQMPSQQQHLETNKRQQLNEQFHEGERFNESQKNKKSIRNRGTSNISISEGDDIVARSLPMNSPETNEQISSKKAVERGIHSQINPKGQWHANTDGFGLGSNSQMKFKESEPAQKKHHEGKAIRNSGNKAQGKAVKYYFTLNEQQEMDPDIAADLAKYLS